jgi:hypothetical protein
VGNTVVGGDLIGATFFGGGGNVQATPALYLYGKLNNSLNLNSGGSLYYAGGNSPQVNYNGGGKHFDITKSDWLLYQSVDQSLGAALQAQCLDGDFLCQRQF